MKGLIKEVGQEKVLVLEGSAQRGQSAFEEMTMTPGSRVAAAVLTSGLLVVGPVWAWGDVPPLLVKVEGMRLSVRAHGVPLAKILEEIRREGRIEFHLDAPIGHETVTESFDALPLDEALRRLLRNKNFAIVHSPGGLAEVWVFPQGGQVESWGIAAEAKPLPARTPAVQMSDQPAVGQTDDAAEPTELWAEALGNPDPAARAKALASLTDSGDDKLALATALEVLRREREEQVLKKALQLLQDQESIPLEPLLALAAGGNTPALRLQVLELLREQGKENTRVRELLATLARTDSSKEVRERAHTLLQNPEAD